MEDKMEKINSPEKLDSYLQVTKPSMWIVFGGVFLFVIAIILWGTLSDIDITVRTGGYVQNGVTYFTVSGSRAEQIEKGQTVYINGERSVIDSIHFSDKTEEGQAEAGADGEERESLYATAYTNRADGYCDVIVEMGSMSPIDFLFQ